MCGQDVFQGKGITVFRFDETLTSMLGVAKSAGYMTYQQVDEYLPDEGGNPRMVAALIMLYDN